METGDHKYPDPILHRMLTEIREETSLEHPRDFRLVKRAPYPPLLIDDPANGLIWQVNAFRFEITEGAQDRIRLDWENSECVDSPSLMFIWLEYHRG